MAALPPVDPKVDYPSDEPARPISKGILRDPGAEAAPRVARHVRFSNATPLDALLPFSSKSGGKGSYTNEQQRQNWDAATKVPYTANAATPLLAEWGAKARLPPLTVLDAILNPNTPRR